MELETLQASPYSLPPHELPLNEQLIFNVPESYGYVECGFAENIVVASIHFHIVSCIVANVFFKWVLLLAFPQKASLERSRSRGYTTYAYNRHRPASPQPPESPPTQKPLSGHELSINTGSTTIINSSPGTQSRMCLTLPRLASRMEESQSLPR